MELSKYDEMILCTAITKKISDRKKGYILLKILDKA